jgi:hypothetical protein
MRKLGGLVGNALASRDRLMFLATLARFWRRGLSLNAGQGTSATGGGGCGEGQRAACGVGHLQLTFWYSAYFG